MILFAAVRGTNSKDTNGAEFFDSLLLKFWQTFGRNGLKRLEA